MGFQNLAWHNDVQFKIPIHGISKCSVIGGVGAGRISKSRFMGFQIWPGLKSPFSKAPIKGGGKIVFLVSVIANLAHDGRGSVLSSVSANSAQNGRGSVE